MGVTNIHHATQVLQRAGEEMTDPALLASFNKAVLLVGRGFEQEEIDNFAAVLHTWHRDKWVVTNGSGVPKVVMSDKGVAIPALYTSPGLEEYRSANHGYDEPKDANGKTIQLAYVIVVRGASAALFSKVRVFYSRFAVAAGIIEEALQGLCVVFSAAMLKGDVEKLGHLKVRFAKVESLREMIKSADEERVTNVIRLCC